MKFHPYAEVFPLLEGAAFDELVADIKAFGLREKIWQYDGKILDGRNRYLACQKAKVKPEYRTFKGTAQGALAFVVSANIHRRQLTNTERAFVASELAKLRHGERKAESPAGDSVLTQAEAAKALNVSKRSVERAGKINKKGSKALQEAAKSGEIGLAKAAAAADLPKRQQLAAATKQTEHGGDTPDTPSADEMADIDAEAEQQYATSIAKVMEADDKLAAANKEIKRQAAEIANLKAARDGFMRGKDEMTRLLKEEQRKTEKLSKQLAKADCELEKLRERIAVMEAA